VVVSVGNLSVGGGGKTPLAMELVRSLADAGARPVYTSRGYGGEAARLDAVTVVTPETNGRFEGPNSGVRIVGRQDDRLPALVGDEGAMAAGRWPDVPVLFGRNKRAVLDVAALLFSPTHVVLDDAFQSWGVWRDLDVVVLDGEDPFGGGWLLPAGRLREPPEALDRADVLGITVDDERGLSAARKTIAAAAGVRKPSFGIVRRLRFESVSGGSVVAMSGIARPETFERQVSASGNELAAAIRFPDHHQYTGRDVRWALEQAGRRGADRIVTTEKDWVKLVHLGPPPGRFAVARLSLEFVDGNPLEHIKKAAE
jgi:tetraacyldisaccharide 4'-kinase